MRRLLLVMVLVLGASPAAAGADDARALQGRWRMVGAFSEGRLVRLFPGTGLELVLTATHCVVIRKLGKRTSKQTGRWKLTGERLVVVTWNDRDKMKVRYKLVDKRLHLTLAARGATTVYERVKGGKVKKTR